MQTANNSDNISISNTNNSLHETLPQFIQNFDKMDMKEVEPTTQNIYDNMLEEDLIIVIDELVNLYFKTTNEGKEERVRKQYILDCINSHKINLQGIYSWLLNNQNDSNSNWLLGYFNYHGIETNENKKKAFELFKKAAELENIVAQYNLAKMYTYGEGVETDHNKVFEISKKLAEKEYLSGISWLGYCYYCGIGTNVDMQKAFKLYQKAANLGNSIAQYNLALMYEFGNEIEKNVDQAIYWYKKSDLPNAKVQLKKINLKQNYCKGILLW